jgi:hypothetical protein
MLKVAEYVLGHQSTVITETNLIDENHTSP